MALAFRCVLDGPSGFQKYVMVKMLHPEHRESSHYYGMFLDEARLCSRLQHPNIPTVFELGEHEELPFLVMEFVDGPNLVLLHRKFRDGHRRHYGNIALIFQRVAQALHHAHTLKDTDGKPLRIVHRDVSLANVLVGRDGHAKLIDFGIAKWEHSETHTEVDVLKGKLRYMAPEQFKKGTLDGRVDIYQAGVALYWLATGRPPFGSAQGVADLQARLESPPPRPSTIIHGFPVELEKVILKALEPRPERRYQTADELAVALDTFIRSDPAHASTESSVAAWISDLFPGADLDVYMTRSPTGTMAATNTRAATGSFRESSKGGGSMPPSSQLTAPQRADDSLSLLQWLGLIGVALLAAGAGAMITNYRSSGKVSATNLLTAAESALREKNFMAARKYLMRAEKLPNLTEDDEEQIAELESELERLKLVGEARRHLDLGDVEKAKEVVTRLLSEIPDDPEANKILRDIQAKIAAPPP
jgi:serine/threonine protein kinase